MARLSRRLWGGTSLKTASKEAISSATENSKVRKDRNWGSEFAAFACNSTSTSVRVTTEFHEKHAHAYQVTFAVFAFELVDTIYSDSNSLDSALQD